MIAAGGGAVVVVPAAHRFPTMYHRMVQGFGA